MPSIFLLQDTFGELFRIHEQQCDLLWHDVDRNPNSIHDESIKDETTLFMGKPSLEAVENDVSKQANIAQRRT